MKNKVNETIRKLENGKYRLYSKSGKNLGTYDTRAGAEKREQQVQYFKHVSEEISEFNPDNPMSSEVLVQGYGTMSIETLMRNVMGGVAELAKLRDGDPQSYRDLQYKLYKNGVFRAKLDALVKALDELQEIKRKGGKRSVNIQREASEQEQMAEMMGGQPQPQEQTMPIDIQQILRFVDDMEDRNQFTREYADKIRRTIGSLTSNRKTLKPHVLLQIMTLLTQGRR